MKLKSVDLTVSLESLSFYLARRRKRRTERVDRSGHGSQAATLSHVDASGRVKMVDVGDKAVTAREAIARGSITMSAKRCRRSGPAR